MTATEITVRVNDDPVTGEHPICGDHFVADAELGPSEQVHEAWCWAAGHASCRCISTPRETSK